MKEFYSRLKSKKATLGAYIGELTKPIVYEVKSEEEAILTRMMLGRDSFEDRAISLPLPVVVIKKRLLPPADA